LQDDMEAILLKHFKSNPSAADLNPLQES